MDAATLPNLSDYEIERGKPMPSLLHSFLQGALTTYLNLHYQNRFLVLPELTLDTPGEKSIPDIALYPAARIDFFHDEIKLKEPPLATIEILSPTQVLQTLLDKTTDYFSFGVRSCWVVLPGLQSIYVFRGPNAHEVFGLGEELHDPNLDIRVPMDAIFGV